MTRTPRTLFFVFLILIITSSASWASWRNRKAPDFELVDINGRRVALSEMRGKVVFIDFWASWCPPCKQEFPELEKLTSQYRDSPFVTLAVSEDKVRSNVNRFTANYPELPPNLIVLLDHRSKAIKKYSVLAMPTSFIIDSSGVIRYIHYGYRESDPEAWRREIDTLLK